jgi:NAD(P)-dependent dehydrogenase (short-subunit alcohol dehydrogenase family)
MLNDLRGKAVLITGGTRGIGLATGLAFGRQGALVTLTHRWGSADEEDIRRQFAAAGAPEPLIIEADVSSDEDTIALMDELRRRHDRIEVLVPGVSFAQKTGSVRDLKRTALLRSMDYSVWHAIGYVQAIEKAFGAFPRYVVGLSSFGPDQFVPNYDVVAACKAALEALFRYLAHRMTDHEVRVNIVRAVYVRSDALASTLGADFADYMDRAMPELVVPASAVADAVLALCSGLMDAVSGQVIVIDQGSNFANNLMGLFERQQRLDRTHGD